jgi:hypothetical protein
MADVAWLGHAHGMRRNTRQIRTLLERLAGPRYPLLSSRLIRCRRCGLDLANPVAWHEHGDVHWGIRLRCGSCGYVRDDDAMRLDRNVAPGMCRIAASLRRLDRETMRADAETLARALQRDLLLPDDFRR